MAKPKSKTKPKSKSTKPATKSKSAPAKHVTKIAPPTSDRPELAMLAWRPQLADRMRDAFRSQCSDARAEKLGGETKATEVLAEARRLAGVIEQTLTHVRAGQTVRYSADRLTYLLENIAELADALARERRGGGADVAASAAVAEQRARAHRRDLALALGEIADGNPTLEGELKAARGGDESTGQLLAALRALADLGTRWATSFDPTVHALTESVGLTRADLTAALAAADALADAIGGKASPRADGSDSQAVNRVEGRVLFELGKALAPMNEAATRGIGETLTASTAIARVLARK